MFFIKKNYVILFNTKLDIGYDFFTNDSSDYDDYTK